MNKILAFSKAIRILLGTGYEIVYLTLNSLIRGETTARNFYHRRRWARRTNRISGIIVDEVQGSIDIPTALVVSNHRTMLDPAVQCAYFDTHIIAKASVGEIPMIGKGAAMTGIVLVKRDKMRSRLAARDMTKTLLSEGKSVLVYAEGTTGTERKTGRMKVGTFAVAAELGVPVIPVAIEYPERKDYWFDGSMGEQIIRQVGAGKTHVKLRIGKPIHSDDSKTLLAAAQAWIDEQLIEMQAGWSKVFDNEI